MQSIPNQQAPELPVEARTTIRVGHLTLIQGVIGRMSAYCANLENYCITIVSAFLAIYAQNSTGPHPNPKIILFALPPVLIFALLDAHYLRLERSFRLLYKEVCALPLDDNSNIDICINHIKKEPLTLVLFSWSVGIFFAPIMIGLVTFYLMEM